jgi:hypothetical protein
MALISCPECHGKLSTLAAACPHCGFAPPHEAASASVVKDAFPVDASREPSPASASNTVAQSRNESCSPWWQPLAIAAKATGVTLVLSIVMARGCQEMDPQSKLTDPVSYLMNDSPQNDLSGLAMFVIGFIWIIGVSCTLIKAISRIF